MDEAALEAFGVLVYILFSIQNAVDPRRGDSEEEEEDAKTIYFLEWKNLLEGNFWKVGFPCWLPWGLSSKAKLE